jgi:hypothetical protein
MTYLNLGRHLGTILVERDALPPGARWLDTWSEPESGGYRARVVRLVSLRVTLDRPV